MPCYTSNQEGLLEVIGDYFSVPVNDCSSDEDYYDDERGNLIIIIINLPDNNKS